MQNLKKRRRAYETLHNAKWSRDVDPGLREALWYRVTRLKPFSLNLGQRRKPHCILFFNIKSLMQKALFCIMQKYFARAKSLQVKSFMVY